MIKKILKISMWVCIAAIFIISLGFVSKQENKMLCKSFEININNSLDCDFVDKEDIKSMLNDKGYPIVNQTIESIDVNSIEKLLYTNPWVKNVNAYINIDGTFKVDLEQRVALLRIFNHNGESYYIDTDGKLMLWSSKCSPVVSVFTGNISEKYNIWCTTSVDEILKNDSIYSVTLLDDIFTMASFISKSEMWKAQVGQIYVNTNNEFEIIPIVGNHRILFGGVENIAEKFLKLEVFYREGLNKTDWNAYDTINIKYKNQIVCSKIN